MMLINPYVFVTGGLPADSLPKDYAATGAETTFTVPAGVTRVRVHTIGASGGAGRYSTGQQSGAGGYATGVISVTPGETLKVRVGGKGKGGQGSVPCGGLGGYPGGGSGSFGDTYGGGGGGYSGVFRNDGTPLIISGAGGGGSGYSTAPGAGGGTTGGNGHTSTGGTQSAGGTGAYPGSAYQGGNANGGNRLTSTSQDGGGGGGGYYGGGTNNGDGQSGSGGSGYIGGTADDPGRLFYAGSGGARPTQTPSTIAGFSTGSYGQGTNSVSSGDAPDGNDGRIIIDYVDLPNFPQVLSITKTSLQTDATSHAIAMPATVSSGDLLIAIVTVDGSDLPTTPSGWTQLSAPALIGSARGALYYKVAAGTEGGTTVDFATPAAEAGAALVYRIKAGTFSSTPEATSAALANVSTVAPPDITPSWGSAKDLFIVCYCEDTGYDVTTWPYLEGRSTAGEEQESADGAACVSCWTQVETASFNPADFVQAFSRSCYAFTIAVRPA